MEYRADFQIVLDDALAHVGLLMEKAEKIYKQYDEEDDAEFGAAYQVYLDLKHANDELIRTYHGIADGYI